MVAQPGWLKPQPRKKKNNNKNCSGRGGSPEDSLITPKAASMSVMGQVSGPFVIGIRSIDSSIQYISQSNILVKQPILETSNHMGSLEAKI